jgi:hypothetical protein
MKRISINGRFLSQPVTGVQRYAHELIRELDRLLTSLPAGTEKRTGVSVLQVTGRQRSWQADRAGMGAA